MPVGPFGLDPLLWAIVRLLIAVVLVVALILNSSLLLIYLERKIQAVMQDRIGPYHTGPFGLLQTFADALKLIAKEDVRAGHTDVAFFIAAPALVFTPMLASYVVLPFAPPLVGADLNIGLLYLATLGSMGVLGIVIAGWASNNKYALVGGLRSAGQLISYEVPGILSLVTAVLVVGSLSMVKITETQTGPLVNLFVLPLAFATYLVSSLAETNRTPFDLPEAESELVAGYLTEYSGMRWGTMLALTEYGNVVVVCSIMTTLWLGGWNGPGVAALPILGVVWFTLKVYALILVFMWVRATLPRLRIDQLMSFCWKILIPTTLLNLAVTAVLLIAFPSTLVPVAIANWILLVAFIVLLPVVQQRRLRQLRKTLRARTAAAGVAS
ncbi:MAG: NADH-quinone oxidoreductase subunit NuoH [Chloroflexota bacterium]|nr:NADH-quinone oxidoreductase subunit NuoH [Chloroflexota bacterium]MDE3193460.1 NADH-quinone oxidoreductase subunit NuoH [Chloroflexota bacterium]